MLKSYHSEITTTNILVFILPGIYLSVLVVTQNTCLQMDHIILAVALFIIIVKDTYIQLTILTIFKYTAQ